MFVLSDDGTNAVNLDHVSALQVVTEGGAGALIALHDGVVSVLVHGSPARCSEGIRAIFEDHRPRTIVPETTPDMVVPEARSDPFLLDLAEQIGPPSEIVVPQLEVPGR